VKGRPLAIAVAVVVALALGWMIFVVVPRRYGGNTQGSMPSFSPFGSTATAKSSADGRKIKARLFFVSGDGTHLTSFEREIAYGEGALDQALILDRQLAPEIPIFAQCADITAAELAADLHHPERLVGFDGLFADGAITLASTPLLSEQARVAAGALVQALGREPIWMADGPALIVPRVVAMLANEAAFALGEGVADAETIDTALRLGANHPAGPLARAAALGYDKVVAILDHLRTEYGEERYRVAPALRRAARVGRM